MWQQNIKETISISGNCLYLDLSYIHEWTSNSWIKNKEYELQLADKKIIRKYIQNH